MNLLLPVKSTLDYACSSLATALSLGFLDMDDAASAEEALKSPTPLLLWEFVGFTEAPRHPLYHLSFSVGIRTSSDPSNYNLLAFQGSVMDTFKVDKTFAIYNSAGAVMGTELLGVIHITSAEVGQQGYDKTSGIRLAHIQGRVRATS